MLVCMSVSIVVVSGGGDGGGHFSFDFSLALFNHFFDFVFILNQKIYIMINQVGYKKQRYDFSSGITLNHPQISFYGILRVMEH